MYFLQLRTIKSKLVITEMANQKAMYVETAVSLWQKYANRSEYHKRGELPLKIIGRLFVRGFHNISNAAIEYFSKLFLY